MGRMIADLRSGHARPLPLGGIVCFPSYHTVMAVLFTWAHRGMRSLWPFAALNMVILLAIPTIGDHYFVDVLAGGLVAAIAMWLVSRLFNPRSGFNRLSASSVVHLNRILKHGRNRGRIFRSEFAASFVIRSVIDPKRGLGVAVSASVDAVTSEPEASSGGRENCRSGKSRSAPDRLRREVVERQLKAPAATGRPTAFERRRPCPASPNGEAATRSARKFPAQPGLDGWAGSPAKTGLRLLNNTFVRCCIEI